MNTAAATSHTIELKNQRLRSPARLFRPPQSLGLGVCRPGRGRCCAGVCALRRIHGRLRESDPGRRRARLIWLGWFWRPLRALSVAVAVFSLLAIWLYQTPAGGADLARADQVFMLKYFISSQSAILWMSMLFFMSTLFYWIGMLTRAGASLRAAGLAPCLGGGDPGAGGHHGALVREPPDRPGHRPHPGQQPVRGVRAVLLDDHGLLPLLRRPVQDALHGRVCDAGGQRGGGLSALVHRGARSPRDPAAGASAAKLVDEAARAGQLHRLRHLCHRGHGGLRLPDQAERHRDPLVQAGAAVAAGPGAVLRADRVSPVGS